MRFLKKKLKSKIHEKFLFSEFWMEQKIFTNEMEAYAFNVVDLIRQRAYNIRLNRSFLYFCLRVLEGAT